MKRIEFIAPVEAVRGNLSGRQDLQYAENNNPAYDSPLGRVNYARNYSPRFIGAKRAADGHKYFQVRTKTATHLTTKAKRAMAVMGGTGALVAAILRAKGTPLYNDIYALFVEYSEMVEPITFRKYLTQAIMGRVKNCIEFIVFTSPTGSPISVENPWYKGRQTAGLAVSTAIVEKFWGELNENAITFQVLDDVLQASDGMAFGGSSGFTGSVLNTIGLSFNSSNYVVDANGHYVVIDNDGTFEYQTMESDIIANQKYITTTQAPE